MIEGSFLEVLFIILFVVGVVFLLINNGSKHDVIEQPRRSNNVRHNRRRAPHLAKPASPPSGRTYCPPVKPTIITGVPYVTDGDSLIIKKVEIRLFGVDAPEMKHPYGNKAKWAMFGLCKGQQVRAEVVGTDTHGRTVAKCYLPDGRDLSAEIVKLGLAIDWPKFSGGVYKSLEVPDARKKMWLADARQKGRMHVWEKYEATRKRA